MNATNNATHVLDTDYPGTHVVFKILCVVAYIAIITVAIIGNTLVCVAFALSPALRTSPTNYFILSLAVSDLLTVTLCVPFDLEQTLTEWEWRHGHAACSLWTIVYLLAVPSSILSLLAVSVDRYKSLCDPLNRFRQTRFMTRKRACVVIAVLWVYATAFAVIPELGWNLYPENIMYGTCYFNITETYSVLSSLLNFVLPLVIMCLLYLRIYQIARQMQKTHQTASLSSCTAENHNHGRHRKRIKKKVKTTKNILIVVCAFFFCWMPLTVFSLVGIFCKPCFHDVAPELYTILLILGYSNSAMNPYLYMFRNNKFKEAYRRALRKMNLFRDQTLSSRRSNTTTAPTLLSDSHTRSTIPMKALMSQGEAHLTENSTHGHP